MTTNHRERLDPALLRPGRADYHAFLDNATYDMMTRLFLRFNPGEEELAHKFAKQLPEKKISMAKLQGHFLTYRDDPKLQVEKVKEILRDNESSEEMTILEYLQRLNLDQYAQAFAKKNLYFVTDLRHFQDERQFSENFDLKDDAKRFSSMMNGDKKTKEDFQLLSKNKAR